jgi:dolichol-phosphate hexosyltransferase
VHSAACLPSPIFSELLCVICQHSSSVACIADGRILHTIHEADLTAVGVGTNMAAIEPSRWLEVEKDGSSNSPPHLHLAGMNSIYGAQITWGTAFRIDDDQAVSIKLSIIMAAYNEERTILQAIRGVLQVPFPCETELIVVDDGSTDKTASLLEGIDDSRITVHRHECNQGKGASLMTAISVATGTHVIPFDADLEYAPEDIARLLGPVLAGRCDVVYGARLFGFNTVYHSYRYALGNRVLTSITNILYNSYLSDLHTCLKLIPLELLQRMRLSEKRFGLDTQVTAFLLRDGVRPFEVPVSYYSRSHAQGKKINWRDAVKCIWILLKTRMLPGCYVRHTDLVAGPIER